MFVLLGLFCKQCFKLIWIYILYYFIECDDNVLDMNLRTCDIMTFSNFEFFLDRLIRFDRFNNYIILLYGTVHSPGLSGLIRFSYEVRSMTPMVQPMDQ
jgi:hypothetical protein